MPNRLANENSPYLLQHANNPVDWFPWGQEALEKARSENKPIFLSIGYAACHWCHVMEHESFEDASIAALMNEYFVNIKVDREERPDLDSIYMTATQAMTGSGGWPMSVFLTPDLQPFYAGTYFPPVRRYNMPSFREVLEALANVWKNEPEKAVDSAERVVAHIRAAGAVSQYELDLKQEHLHAAVKTLLEGYDWGYGGWGDAPKFPQPMVIEFLLRRHVAGDAEALKPAVHALDAMTRGGMYDVVGGGFSRYSTDLLDPNNNLSRGMTCAHMPHRLRRVFERIRSVDDRCNFACLNQVFDKRQVTSIRRCEEIHNRLPAAPRDERTLHHRFEDLIALTTDHHIPPLRLERAAILCQRAITVHSQNQVIALTDAGEILTGVINDMIRAQRTKPFHFFRAGYCCDFRAEGFCDLHSERAHASRRADNCHSVPGLDATLTQSLQRRDRRHRHCRRLLKGQVGRLFHQNRFTCAGIFSKTAKGSGDVTEDFIARL
jgi:hypothetical protein